MKEMRQFHIGRAFPKLGFKQYSYSAEHNQVKQIYLVEPLIRNTIFSQPNMVTTHKAMPATEVGSVIEHLLDM